jgi:hypothetical protein
MEQMKNELGVSMLYITHDIATARYVAEDLAVMYVGHMVEWERWTRSCTTPAPLHPVAHSRRCRTPRRASTPSWREAARGRSRSGPGIPWLSLCRALPSGHAPLQGEPAAGDPARRQPLPCAATSTNRGKQARGRAPSPGHARVGAARPRNEPRLPGASLRSKTLMELLINQVGYECDGEKSALLQCGADLDIRGHVRLLRQQDDHLCWRRRWWRRMRPRLAGAPLLAGRFLRLHRARPLPAGGRRDHGSAGAPGALPPCHRPGLLARRCLSDVIHYFKGQRASGTFDRADRRARLFGTDQRRDVHGGWFDASGDMSKYLSHLSYANYSIPSRPPWWSGPCSSAGNSWRHVAISTG